MEGRGGQWIIGSIRVVVFTSLLLPLSGFNLIGQLPLAAAQEKISLRLAFIPNGYDGPFFIARGKGYYREEGLDVTIPRGFGSADTAKRVAVRSDTFGTVDVFTVVKAVAEGAALKLVGSTVGEGTGVIMALKKSGIRQLKDLEGRTLGSTPGSAFHLQLPALFRAANVHLAKVRIADMDIVLKSSALIAGKVDAITGMAPSEPPAFKVRGIEVDVIEYRQYLKILGMSFVVHQDLVRQRPDLIRKILRATYRGARDFAQNVSEGVEFLSRGHPEVDRQTYLEQAQVSLALWVPSLVKERGFGWIDDALMRNTIEVAVSAHKIGRPPRAEDLYTNEFLPVPPIKP